MTENIGRESPTSAGSPGGPGAVPPVVIQVARELADRVGLGLALAGLLALALVLGVLFTIAWNREPLPLYVLGG